MKHLISLDAEATKRGRLCGRPASVDGVVGMPREELILLLTQAFERAADRLRTEGHDDPWPDDLWPQELVRLLREHSRAIIASLGGEGIDR